MGVIWGISERGVVALGSQSPPVQSGRRCGCAWAGSGVGWLLSHCVGRGIRRNVGLPSAELAPDKVPQPWGLASPLQGPFPIGPGEDDSAPREGREARPAQGAQGRAGSQAGSGTEQAGVFVLCPMSHAGTRGGGGGCHPRALQAQLPGRSRVRLSGMSRNTKEY